MKTTISLVWLLGVVALGLGAASARRQAAPPTVVGRWTLTSDASGDASVLELKLDGAKITGMVNGPTGTYAVAGEYKDGTLKFTMDYQGQLTIAFTGKLQDDGSLAGTMDYGQGPVNWRAVRVKDAGTDVSIVLTSPAKFLEL